MSPSLLSAKGRRPGFRERGLPERCYPAAALVFLAVSAFYVATLAPGLMPGDSGDVLVAAASYREAHPSGFPLYGLLGKLFLALPVGDIPYRGNLMAAFLGGVAAAFLFLSVLLLTRHAAASLAGALLFAFSRLFWTYSTLAEVFCLNNCFLALTAFLALLWRQRHFDAPGSLSDRQTLGLLAFAAGLSLGNHLSMVATFPGLLAFTALVDRDALRLRRAAPVLSLFLLGAALPYLYLAGVGLLYPYHHWEDPSTLRGLVRLLLRVRYGTFQMVREGTAAAGHAYRAAAYLGDLATQYLAVGFLVGLAGLVLRGLRDRAFLAYSGSAFLIGLSVVAKANVDPRSSDFDAATLERLYQVPHLFFLLWVGVGLALLARAIEGRRPANAPGPLLAACVVLMLPLALLCRNAPHASQRENHLYPRFMEDILSTLPPNAVLMTWTDTVGLGVDYLQTVERRRPDVAYVRMGIAGSEPYASSARREYPRLFWPAGPDGEPFDASRFIHENLRRHRVFLDIAAVPLEYPTVPFGLVWEVLPYGSSPEPSEVVRTNEALWGRFDVRGADVSLYPPGSMSRSVVKVHYLRSRSELAGAYERWGYHAEARRHRDACRAMDPSGSHTSP